MAFSKSLLDIIIQANAMSPKFAGQLFAYDARSKKFIKKDTLKSKYKYNCCSVFLLLFAFVMVLHILQFLQAPKTDQRNTKIPKENLCIMCMLISLLVASYCRTREKMRDDFINFLNGIIDVTTHLQGTAKIRSLKCLKLNNFKIFCFKTYNMFYRFPRKCYRKMENCKLFSFLCSVFSKAIRTAHLTYFLCF